MTTPEVDQELQRLFSVARAATTPDAEARVRVRAGLALQLASDVAAPHRAWRPRAWFGVGLAVVGVCAVALWLARAVPQRLPAAALPPVPATLDTPPPTPAAPPPVSGAPAPAKLPPAAPARETSKPSASSSHDADPVEELALVRGMQQALRSGNAGQALALAAEHARRFPHGTLAEEREGVRAVAQCQLAAADARAAIWAQFTAHFPSSPYAARVKAACQ